MYSGELLKIYNGTGSGIRYDGENFPNGSYVPLGKFVSYKVSFNKLWGPDTGRSMTGENKGTFIGIFTKIEVNIGNMTEENMAAIINLTAQANANVKYFDAGKRDLVTASFYFGDVSAELRRKKSMESKPTSFSIIANRRRV